jgi:hypothetical protein
MTRLRQGGRSHSLPKSGCFSDESRVVSASARIIVLLLLLCVPNSTAFAQSNSSQPRPKSLDPMNRPMDELGVTGKDYTLCTDRWYSCTTYDRLQFDQKYPGQPLNELLRFGAPDWPDRGKRRSGYGSHKSERFGSGRRTDDRLDTKCGVIKYVLFPSRIVLHRSGTWMILPSEWLHYSAELGKRSITRKCPSRRAPLYC